MAIKKRPCGICRRWFRPDPRVGERQRVCSSADCQRRRRLRTQAAWRARNPDYFVARRIMERAAGERQPPDPLRLPAPLSRLPWDLAQDQFGVQGADFVAVLGRVLLGAAQVQRRAQPPDTS
jgi:hypothetical protein